MELKKSKSMLEYSKLILTKMRFDSRLFRKEYKKTFLYLEPVEHNVLKNWLREQNR